jgi:hypothetical protein
LRHLAFSQNELWQCPSKIALKWLLKGYKELYTLLLLGLYTLLLLCFTTLKAEKLHVLGLFID